MLRAIFMSEFAAAEHGRSDEIVESTQRIFAPSRYGFRLWMFFTYLWLSVGHGLLVKHWPIVMRCWLPSFLGGYTVLCLAGSVALEQSHHQEVHPISFPETYLLMLKSHIFSNVDQKKQFFRLHFWRHRTRWHKTKESIKAAATYPRILRERPLNFTWEKIRLLQKTWHKADGYTRTWSSRRHPSSNETMLRLVRIKNVWMRKAIFAANAK